MSLLTELRLSAKTIELLAEASAAVMNETKPDGWTVFRSFNDPRTGASAKVYQKDGAYILAFDATNDSVDASFYPLLATGQYIRLFDSFLKSLPSDAKYYVTGASLGGGAANQLASIAGSAYGGKFADATFVAFASPNVSSSTRIVNFGFENDPIYKLVNRYGNSPSAMDNVALANDEYLAGNYNGRRPQSFTAHEGSPDIMERLFKSSFLDVMKKDSPIVFAASNGVITDQDPGRTKTGAFYIGRDTADKMTGRAGADRLDGFAGADDLKGGAGADFLAGGRGNDTLDGGVGVDTAVFSGSMLDYSRVQNPDLTWTVTDNRGSTGDGRDSLASVELLMFADATVVLHDLATSLKGDAGNNTFIGGAGNDTFRGNGGDETLDGGAGTDRAVYASSSSRYSIVQNDDGSWTVTDNRLGSPDGTDTLTNIETLKFADKSVNLVTLAANLAKAAAADAGAASAPPASAPSSPLEAFFASLKTQAQDWHL